MKQPCPLHGLEGDCITHQPQQSNESSATPELELVYPGNAEECRPAEIRGRFVRIRVDRSENYSDPKSLAELIIKSVNAYDENQATIKDLQERSEKQGKVIKDCLRVLRILNDAFSEVKDGEPSGKYMLNRHRFEVTEILNSIPNDLLP